jgi:hypothetical protein
MAQALESYGQYRGDVVFYTREIVTRKFIQIVRKRNLILYGAADAMAQMLAGTPGYHVATMYMEFKNLAAPGDPITLPTFDRSGGIDYYNGLVASADTDFLRLPIHINPGFSTSDAANYANNKTTFFATSEGTAGFHGKPFGSGANSAVYGAALVASPDPEDQAEDIVFSRTYATLVSGWSAALPKESGTEIGVDWTIRFD